MFFPFKATIVSLGKYGGIDVGSTGVKMVGVEYFQTDAGVRERLLAEPSDVNPQIGDLRRGTDDFDDRALERTVSQVGDYFDALTKLGVPSANIYIACSSGVLASFKTEESRQRNRERLAKAIHEKTGKAPDFIDARAEAKYAFEEIVPPSEWSDALLIDIGGHDIRGGAFIRQDTFLDFHAKVGPSSFATKAGADKDRESFVSAARGPLKSEVEEPLDADLAPVSQLRDRRKIYFLGSVPWRWPPTRLCG